MPHHNLPFPPTSVFIGRHAELAELSAALRPPTDRIRSDCLLTGMAGSGKSQLALQFACNNAHMYKWICWLDGHDPHLRTKLEQLRTQTQNGLLIIDDINQTEQIIPYIPQTLLLSVLMTSRRRDIPASYKIEIGALPKDVVHELLGIDQLLPSERDALLVLLERLGYLSLAVTLLARLLQSGIYEPSMLLSAAQQMGTLGWIDRELSRDYAMASMGSLQARLEATFLRLQSRSGHPEDLYEHPLWHAFIRERTAFAVPRC